VAIVAALALLDLGVVAKSFDIVAKLDERAECGDTRDFAFHDLADFVLLEPLAPDVVDLLDAERDAAIIGIDLQNLGRDGFALFENFMRILDALRPANVADVDEAVKAFFDFHEGAELRDVADFSCDNGADGILFGNENPGIGERLLDAERDAAVAGLDVQDDDVDFFADFKKLRRMLNFFRPAQLGDMDKTFDALFELDEDAVVDDAHDLASYLAAGRILFRSIDPGIGAELLKAERDALLFLIKLQDDDVEFLLRLYHVGRMLDAAPAEVGEMEKTVDAAEINESAVFGDVLDVAVHDLAFRECLHQLRALGVQLFFENGAAADDHVAATAVELGDADLHFRAGQVVEVLRGAKIKLRAGQKRADADIDNEAALDAVHHFAGDGFLGLEGRFDLFPGAAAENFLIGENGEAVFVLAGALNFNGGVGLGTGNIGFGEFRRGDQAFGFSAEVHDHAVFRIGDHPYFDNFVLRGSFVLLVVLLHQLAHLFGAGGFFGSSGGFGIGWR